MKPGDVVLYRIQISGMTKTNVQIVAGKIGISYSQMIITDDTILIPRLNTKWRGDADEQAWQDELRKNVSAMGTVSFDAQPWSLAPGYPQGKIGEPSPVKE